MEITTALLCDFAQVREGLLFVSSGGITRVYHPPGVPFPQVLGLHLAVTIEIGPDEIHKVHEIKVKVTQQNSAAVLGQATGAMQPSGPMQLEAGEAGTFPIVVPLTMIPLPTLGAYDVHISVDSGTPRMLTVYLKDPPPGMKMPKVSGLPLPPHAQPPRPNRDQRRHPKQGP